MMLSRAQNYIGNIVNDYTFVIILYSLVLFIASHTQFFWWTFVGVGPLAVMPLGYALKSYLDQHNTLYGFRVMSVVMTYEVHRNHKYTLHYFRKIKAASNHLLSYPITYQWTGSGEGSTPQITGRGQQLLGIVKAKDRKKTVAATPYQEHSSGSDAWDTWFIAFDPPLSKGDIVDIQYTQEFNDKNGTALPRLFYLVRLPMDSLELNVTFPKDILPKSVTCSYAKPSDPRHSYIAKGVKFDPHKRSATWLIRQPKKGYVYQIDWA